MPLGPPTNFTWNNSTSTLSWTNDPEATEVEIQVKSNEPNSQWETVYEGPGSSAVLSLDNGSYSARGRSKDETSGWGLWSGEELFVVGT